MAIQRLQLYQSNQDPNNRQVYVSSPNGKVDVFRVDAETFSRLAGLGLAVQTVGNTFFQPAYGGDLYQLSGEAAFNKLKEFATSPSDNPYVDFSGTGGNAEVSKVLLQNKNLFEKANFSSLPTTGGDVVIKGVNDAQTMMAQGKSTFGGPQNIPGYVAPSSGGTGTGGAAAGGGSTQYGQVLTLPNGQRISPQDPNYAAYAQQLGVSPTSAVGTTPTGTATGGTSTSANAGGNLTKPVTGTAFKETASYKALSAEMRDFVDMAYNLIEVGGEDEARAFSNAISQAQAIAEPYFKTQLALAKAEILGSIAEKNNDFETRAEIIKRTRDELLADVSANKDFLTLEQQAEVARTAQEYDVDLLDIADQAAEKGVTFATGARSRALAEERRGEQYKDVVQSSGRRFNFQQKELELKAQRGDTDAQKQLEALNASKSFALQGIGRAAEQVLGSANVPQIAGFTPVGGAMGSIEEEKRKAISSDIAGFMGLQKAFV